MKYFAIAALFTPGLFVSGKVEWSKTKGDITVNGYTEYSLRKSLCTQNIGLTTGQPVYVDNCVPWKEIEFEIGLGIELKGRNIEPNESFTSSMCYQINQ